jgi:hypothetical protein
MNKPEYRVQIYSKEYCDWETFSDGRTNSKKQGVKWAINARKKFGNKHKIRLIEVRQRVIPVPRQKIS